MSCDVGKATKGLENELWRRWSDGKVGEWAELILQFLRHFTYVTTQSPTLPSLYPRHSSFPNPSVASPTSQFILQPLFRFSYVKALHLIYLASSAHSPNFPSLHLRHNSFSKFSVGLSTSQLIPQPFHYFTYVTVHSGTLIELLLRQSSSLNSLGELCSFSTPFRHFTYVTTHSQTLPSLYLRHSSFPNPSVASPTSQFILQPLFRFSYVKALHLIHLASSTHSPIFPSLHLRHNSFPNPSVTLPTSQALHLIHLASRPCSAQTPEFHVLATLQHNFLKDDFSTQSYAIMTLIGKCIAFGMCPLYRRYLRHHY